LNKKKAAAAGYGCKCKRRNTAVVATFTTGILRRNPGTNFAVVDVVNLSRLYGRRVAVQVFDWSNGTPVALPVMPCNATRCVVNVPVNASRFLYADVSDVAFTYEVRVTRIVGHNLVTNVFGLSNAPLTPQTGNNVLERELVRLRRMK